jgi:hypothetical protein
MKKIVRLTENDLTRIVKRVIREGGYSGIKNELKYDKGLLDITTGLMSATLRFGETIRKIKAMLSGDTFDYYKSNVILSLSKKINQIFKRVKLLERLIRSFNEREMVLSKSDLDDYGFDLSKFLDDLSSRYDELYDLKNMTDDEELLDMLRTYEEDMNTLVDLLYEIPN